MAALVNNTRLAQKQVNKNSIMDWGQAPRASPIPEELLAVDGHLGRKSHFNLGV